MAWFARVATSAVLSGDSAHFRVDYVDDGAPNTVLHSAEFSFGPQNTIPELQAQIVAVGKHARDTFTVVTSFNQNVPVGTLVPIS